ncbi:unnamed protein product [Thlaspi arvense]|uniref:Uncharacterized protein n=1 Tax=Thlaspi arvense TaxID=13288 RepID=A0AAU9RH03_THLAR|nr:unnamed protein product [Thlaspi arvense]
MEESAEREMRRYIEASLPISCMFRGISAWIGNCHLFWGNLDWREVTETSCTARSSGVVGAGEVQHKTF